MTDTSEVKRLADEVKRLAVAHQIAEKKRFECDRYINCYEDGPSERAQLKRDTEAAAKALADFHSAIDRLAALAQRNEQPVAKDCLTTYPLPRPMTDAPRGKRVLVFDDSPNGGWTTAHLSNYPGRPDSWVNPGCHKLVPACWLPLPPNPTKAGEPDEQREPPATTGWPAGMLQDDSRELSRALASKPDARLHAREAAEALRPEPPAQEAVANPNESIEYVVVQDGCEQYGAGTLKEAKGWANANGPWALSIYEVRRTCLVSYGKLLPAPPASPPGWQPIETAPKDGTLVLLGGRNGVWVGKYRPVYTSGYRPENPWSSHLVNHYHMAERYTLPTHWMPLPPAPTSPVEGSKP